MLSQIPIFIIIKFIYITKLKCYLREEKKRSPVLWRKIVGKGKHMIVFVTRNKFLVHVLVIIVITSLFPNNQLDWICHLIPVYEMRNLQRKL